MSSTGFRKTAILPLWLGTLIDRIRREGLCLLRNAPRDGVSRQPSAAFSPTAYRILPMVFLTCFLLACFSRDHPPDISGTGLGSDSAAGGIDTSNKAFVSEDFFQQTLYGQYVSTVIDTSLGVGKLSSFNSVHGSPAAMNPFCSPLVGKYQLAQVPMARIPVGDGGDYSLAGIFPDPDAPVDSTSSYNFANIDRSMEFIIKSGAVPLWQATYDIGDTDSWHSQSCFHEGQAPADLDKWADVIRHVLAHFNDGWADGHDWNVEYVEFLNEPFKSLLYQRDDYHTCWIAFAALSRAIDQYNQDTGRNVKVVGFANPIDPETGYEDDYSSDFWLVESFLGYLRENDVNLNIFSYHLYGDYLEQFETAQNVRERLDDAGFDKTPIWLTEWNTRGLEDTDKDAISAFYASHNIQVKTALQGRVERMFVFRASQRPLGDGDTMASFKDCDDTNYLDLDSTPRPAYFSWLMMRDMQGRTPIRLRANPVDQHKVTFLAGTTEKIKKLGLVVSYWAEQLQADQVKTYTATFTGLDPYSTWLAIIRAVDSTTSDYQPIETKKINADMNGVLEVTGSFPPWTIHYWQLSMVPGTGADSGADTG